MRRNKYTYSFVFDYIKSFEHQLLSKRYINAFSKLKIKCHNGHIYFMEFARFKQGTRCSECSKNKKYTIKDVKNKLKQFGYILLSKVYINALTPLKIKCPKGHISESIRFGNFNYGSRCDKCNREFLVGENNNNWNDNLSIEERLNGRMLKKNYIWIKSVFKKDDYICQCCRQKGCSLEAHHLEGYHWCKELRFEVSNGVTLCKDCHKEFHHLFGNKWNTSEQFYQFLRMKND